MTTEGKGRMFRELTLSEVRELVSRLMSAQRKLHANGCDRAAREVHAIRREAENELGWQF